MADGGRARGWELSDQHRGRRCRSDDESVAARLQSDLRRSRAGVYRGSDQCARIDAAAVPLVIWNAAGSVQAQACIPDQSSNGTIRAAEYCDLPDSSAAGITF